MNANRENLSVTESLTENGGTLLRAKIVKRRVEIFAKLITQLTDEPLAIPEKNSNNIKKVLLILDEKWVIRSTHFLYYSSFRISGAVNITRKKKYIYIFSIKRQRVKDIKNFL